MSPREPPGALLRVLEVAVVIGALLDRRPVRRLPERVDPKDLAAGYEHGDMDPGVVVSAAVALLVMLGIVLLAVTLLEQVMVGLPFTISRPADLISGLQASAAPTPPRPALEAEPGQTLDPYRTYQTQKLNSYAWVDRSAGVIRMPIDRAIDVTAQRGLPGRPAPTATPSDDGATSPSGASSGRVEESYP